MIFFKFSDFFFKVGTLWWRNCRFFFVRSSKTFKNKFEIWIFWDQSKIDKNKVKNLGGHSPYTVETARPFMIIQAIMAPPAPHLRIGLSKVQICMVLGFQNTSLSFKSLENCGCVSKKKYWQFNPLNPDLFQPFLVLFGNCL